MIFFDVADQRKIGDGFKLKVDEDVLRTVADEAGVPQDVVVDIKIRFRDYRNGAPISTIEMLDEGGYRIVFYLLPKAELSDSAAEKLNSALMGRMRQVAQHQMFGIIVMQMFPDQYASDAKEYADKAKISDETPGKALWALT